MNTGTLRIVYDISSLQSWHIPHSVKPSGLSGLFFCSKAPTFFPTSYPTLNIQVGVVEHFWNLALWTLFPAIPATQLHILPYIHIQIIHGIHLFLPWQITLWSGTGKSKHSHQSGQSQKERNENQLIVMNRYSRGNVSYLPHPAVSPWKPAHLHYLL